jgi:hypothetical protein
MHWDVFLQGPPIAGPLWDQVDSSRGEMRLGYQVLVINRSFCWSPMDAQSMRTHAVMSWAEHLPEVDFLSELFNRYVVALRAQLVERWPSRNLEGIRLTLTECLKRESAC